jgi:hypothetical protein
MADSILVDSVALTLIARVAIVLATGVGLPGAFWMSNRSMSSSDAISAKIDPLKDQAIETNGAMKLMQQLQSNQARILDDHGARLRAAESQARVVRSN